jgi:organic hydroperoxide reductase OsmC/OhrA
MNKQHSYEIEVRWVGNQGTGTSSYKAYSRNFEVAGAHKPILPGSSDPSFRGDKQRYNPEEMLVAAISSCHMLWYLHLCAEAGVTVLEYRDQAHGAMLELENGSGHFERVVLRPDVLISADSDEAKAEAVHEQAHRSCFIANSINFPIVAEPTVRRQSD